MAPPPTIALIGPRASGKTSLGRRLADALGRTFIDLDARILEHLGVSSVAEAWAREGEPGWRRAEDAALEGVLDAGRVVLALGGGTPMIEAARRRLEAARERGDLVVVYLECPVEELERRLRAEPGDRPSLTGSDPADEIGSILAAREATYRRLADTVFAAWGAEQQELAERLASEISPAA